MVNIENPIVFNIYSIYVIKTWTAENDYELACVLCVRKRPKNIYPVKTFRQNISIPNFGQMRLICYRPLSYSKTPLNLFLVFFSGQICPNRWLWFNITFGAFKLQKAQKI